MSTATTFAPSSANRWTVASPMPLPAPVTTAVRPSSLPATKNSFQIRSKYRRSSQSVTAARYASSSTRAIVA